MAALVVPLAVLVTGDLWAAPGPGAPNGSAPAPAGAAPMVPALSPQEMLEQGQAHLGKMNSALRRLQDLQESARKEKDIIKLNCVTDKLAQVRVNINIAERSLSSLQESISKADEGTRSHEFTKLSLVSQKVQVLATEAEACIGEDLSFVGDSRVDTDQDPTLPKDPTIVPDPNPGFERPPEASPYR